MSPLARLAGAQVPPREVTTVPSAGRDVSGVPETQVFGSAVPARSSRLRFQLFCQDLYFWVVPSFLILLIKSSGGYLPTRLRIPQMFNFSPDRQRTRRSARLGP